MVGVFYTVVTIVHNIIKLVQCLYWFFFSSRGRFFWWGFSCAISRGRITRTTYILHRLFPFRKKRQGLHAHFQMKIKKFLEILFHEGLINHIFFFICCCGRQFKLFYIFIYRLIGAFNGRWPVISSGFFRFCFYSFGWSLNVFERYHSAEIEPPSGLPQGPFDFKCNPPLSRHEERGGSAMHC